MKRVITTFFALLLFTTNTWATATCSDNTLGEGKVVVTEYQSIKVSGLASKGIKNGTYNCLVLGVGPGYLSMQSELQCQSRDESGVVIGAWMIEGLNIFGQPSASVTLYLNGVKIFESGCKRN